MRKVFLLTGCLALLALIGGLLMLNKSAPDAQEIRANPSLFTFADYPETIPLHTRLSTLFPRGSDFADIDAFFKAANITRGGEKRKECVIEIAYERAIFIVHALSRKLEAIQINSGNEPAWPAYKSDCRAVKNTPARQTGIGATPLTPSGQIEKPIYLPLEPIPGVTDP